MNANVHQNNEDDEDAVLDAGREMMERYEQHSRADFEARIEEQKAIKPALEAAGLTSFVRWLNARRWTPESQHAYNLAVEYALSVRQK